MQKRKLTTVNACPEIHQELLRRASAEGKSLTGFLEVAITRMFALMPEEPAAAFAYLHQAREEGRWYPDGVSREGRAVKFGRIMMINKTLHRQVAQRARSLGMQTGEYLERVLRVFLGRSA